MLPLVAPRWFRWQVLCVQNAQRLGNLEIAWQLGLFRRVGREIEKQVDGATNKTGWWELEKPHVKICIWFKYVLCQEPRLNSWRSMWAEHHGTSPKIRWQIIARPFGSHSLVAHRGTSKPRWAVLIVNAHSTWFALLHFVQSPPTPRSFLWLQRDLRSLFFVSNGHQMTRTIDGLETPSDHQSYWSIIARNQWFGGGTPTSVWMNSSPPYQQFGGWVPGRDQRVQFIQQSLGKLSWPWTCIVVLACLGISFTEKASTKDKCNCDFGCFLKLGCPQTIHFSF